MPGAKATEADSAAGVGTAPRAAAPWRVARVRAKSGMRLQVEFVDGTSGEVNLKAFLQGPRIAGTLFEQLRDTALFAQVRVELGAVTWPNGADLAPDAMYDAIRAEGHWTPVA